MTVFAPFLARFGSALRIVFKVPPAMLATFTTCFWHYDRAPSSRQPQVLTFIPWFSWANRGEGEMRIWVNEAEA